MTNCPNCGAPITGYRCEYCETVFYEHVSEEDELDKIISDCSRAIEEWIDDYVQYHLALQKEINEKNKDLLDSVGGTALFVKLFVAIMTAALLLYQINL